jgi:excisionase family DNA binding protein
MDTDEMEHEEGLWDANDVAKFLKASRSWVYQKAQAGQLPCVKIGGLLRFEPAAIRAFIRGQSAKNQ